jgi:hypothetical protein
MVLRNRTKVPVRGEAERRRRRTQEELERISE